VDKNRLFFVNVRPCFVHFDKNRPLFIQTGPKVASDLRPQMSVFEGRPFYVHLRTNSASAMCSHLSIFDPCIAFKSDFVRNGLSVPHPLLSVLLIRLFCDQLCLNEVDLKRSTLVNYTHASTQHETMSKTCHPYCILLSVVLIVQLRQRWRPQAHGRKHSELVRLPQNGTSFWVGGSSARS